MFLPIWKFCFIYPLIYNKLFSFFFRNIFILENIEETGNHGHRDLPPLCAWLFTKVKKYFAL